MAWMAPRSAKLTYALVRMAGYQTHREDLAPSRLGLSPLCFIRWCSPSAQKATWKATSTAE
ncbi:hypothetical protein RvY_11829 [Ramazzottius varieornatus]|uniref:Uncharacterized protein n=1 Tax=Ramazzottius varieornatus TaxID=947166 RepID=A0A1D1VJE9_RAMVA|nr:hypothetical protein RvY_11829 [Ramazzottius varieornatus]